MAFADIPKHFAAAIEDEEAQVVALSGNWGSGKSHLWNQYQKNSSLPRIQNAIYVSLFGVRTIHALKMKLLASSAEGPKGDNRVGKFMTSGASAVAKFLKGLHRSAEAIDDIALLTLPYILSDSFVVLDDIERKHNLLEIDEVLGFIDEFTTKHGTRFLLILNTDKLSDNAIWEKFREKVIHHEISLEITPDEAFDVANTLNPSTYSAVMKRANQVIGVSNIRVLSKAIAFIAKLCKNHPKLEDKVQERFIPAAFLLCVLHYKVLSDGPTVDYVLVYNALLETAAAQENGDDDKLRRWSELMRRLGLFKSDQFEREVAAALRTGWIEYVALDEAISAYQSSFRTQLAEKRVRDFVSDYSWDHKKSIGYFFTEATAMLDIILHLNTDSISALVSVVIRMGQPNIADLLVQRWLTTHSFTPKQASTILCSRGSEFFPPAIIAQLKLTSEQTVSLSWDLATVAQRIQNKNYTEEDENFIATSSVKQYTNVLNSLDKEDFADFIRMHLDWVRWGGRNSLWKEAGLHNFVEACARIVEEHPEARLAGILRNFVFKKDVSTGLRNNVRGDD